MLRLLRSRPNLFRSSLRGLRADANVRPEPETLHFQRVRIRRKWFKPWAFVGAAAVYYVCFQVYTTSVFAIIGKWWDRELAQMSPKERKQLDEEMKASDGDDFYFIPLPLTTHMVEPPPYKGTDPEWREFAKLSRDTKRINQVKFTLANHVRQLIETHPVITREYGKDWKLTRTWFDVNYPRRPPPTFERQGLCWDDEGLSIATMPVNSELYFRLQRTLMPTAMTLSMWTFSVTLAKHNLMGVAKQLGFTPNIDSQASVQQTLDRMRQHMDKPPLAKPPGVVSGSSSLDSKSSPPKDERALISPSPSPEGSSDPSSGRGLPGPLSPFTKPAAESDGKHPSAKDMYGVREVSEHTNGAWAALKKQWYRVWRPIRPLPPRGSVEFRGLVEVANQKASLVLDLRAFYDPAKNVIHNPSMVCLVRTIKPRQMVPGRR